MGGLMGGGAAGASEFAAPVLSAGGTAGLAAPNLTLGSMAPSLSQAAPVGSSIGMGSSIPSGASAPTGLFGMSPERQKMLQQAMGKLQGFAGGQVSPAPQLQRGPGMPFQPYQFSRNNYHFRRPQEY